MEKEKVHDPSRKIKRRQSKSRRSISASRHARLNQGASGISLASSKSRSNHRHGRATKNASTISVVDFNKSRMLPVEPPKPVDPKKSFPDFLEKSGIKNAIMRAIVALYEEAHKPDDPIGFISRLLGYGIPSEEKINKYQAYLEKLRSQYAKAKDENAELTAMYKAKQLEHRKLVLLEQKCAEQKQKSEHRHHRRALLRSRQKAEAEAKQKKREIAMNQQAVMRSKPDEHHSTGGRALVKGSPFTHPHVGDPQFDEKPSYHILQHLGMNGWTDD